MFVQTEFVQTEFVQTKFVQTKFIQTKFVQTKFEASKRIVYFILRRFYITKRLSEDTFLENGTQKPKIFLITESTVNLIIKASAIVFTTIPLNFRL